MFLTNSNVIQFGDNSIGYVITKNTFIPAIYVYSIERIHL